MISQSRMEKHTDFNSMRYSISYELLLISHRKVTFNSTHPRLIITSQACPALFLYLLLFFTAILISHMLRGKKNTGKTVAKQNH